MKTMQLMINKLKICPSTLIFLGILMIIMSITNAQISIILNVIILHLSVFAHELGHAITGLFFGYEIKKIEIMALGGSVEFTTKNWMSNSRHRFYISAAGPLTNLIIAALFHTAHAFTLEINFLLAIFNLIPILPMDGGNMIVAITENYKLNGAIAPCIGILSGVVAIGFFDVGFIGIILLTIFIIFNMLYILNGAGGNYE